MTAQTKRVAVALLASSSILPHTSHAAGPPAAGELAVACDGSGLPRQREVGALLGQANFSQVYASRQALLAEVRRACHRGAQHVLLRTASADRARRRTDARVARRTPVR